jgi:triacylglycerol lipase
LERWPPEVAPLRTRTTWSELLRPGDAAGFFECGSLPSFDPVAGGFNQSIAWWLAELSRLVYRHEGEGDGGELVPLRSEFLRRAGLTQIRFFNSAKTGTQAFLVASENPSFAVLAFRGTEQRLRDFATDATFLQVPFAKDGSAQVHEGFKHALDSVWPDIAEELGRLSVPVFFTGHSLGAALATLATARREPGAAYTFGCPRVGDSAFAGSLGNLPLYRVVYGADIVPFLPPEGLGFVHGGELHKIGPQPDLAVADSPKALRESLASAFLSFPDPPLILADHALINYVEWFLRSEQGRSSY